MATVTGMTAEEIESRLGTKVDLSALSELIDDRVSELIVAGDNITKEYDDTSNALVISASGGGGSGGPVIVAASEVIWTSAARTNTVEGAGTSKLNLGTPTISSVDAYSGSTLPAINFDTTTTPGELLLTDPGWYIASVRVSAGFTSGQQPTKMNLFLLRNGNRTVSGLGAPRWEFAPLVAGEGSNIDGRTSSLVGTSGLFTTDPFYSPGSLTDDFNSICQPLLQWNNGNNLANGAGGSTGSVLVMRVYKLADAGGSSPDGIKMLDAESTHMGSESGYPSFDSWTIYGNEVGATTSGVYLVVPTGVYMAQVKLDLTVTTPQDDFSMGLNLFDSSSYVTQEMPLAIVRASGGVLTAITAGPWPIETTNGYLSVSFYYPDSPGVPAFAASPKCSIILTKIR